MKFPSLFNKIPRHKRFNYEPRWYDPEVEKRKEREERIRAELGLNDKDQDATSQEEIEEAVQHRSTIAGSFKSARRTASRQSDPSAGLIRLVVLLILTILLIAYLQFGNVALYGLLVFIPLYAFMKLRGKGTQ